MWRCNLCMREIRKRANLIRHIRLIHKINDREFRNASKITNNDTGVLSHKEVQSSETSYGQHSRMGDKGRPMSEHYREPSYEISQLRMEAPLTREDGNNEARSITEQEFRTIGSELREIKCRILDGVLECIPDHMKVKARCICDILKRLDLFFLNRDHELIFQGQKLQGSNIHTLIEEILMCCPKENIQPTRKEAMKNAIKCTLKTHVPRITSRESET